MPGCLWRRLSLLSAGLLSLWSCGGSSGPTGVTPAIAIALVPTSGSAPQGGSLATTATAIGSGGFTGAATFAVTGQPTGVTVLISNQQTVGSVTTATIGIAVGAAAIPGNSTLTVTASGAGVTSVTASYTLTVTSAVVPGYTLSANPAAINVAQGGNANSTITIARTGGFIGSVAFTATGASSGLSAAFAPTSTTTNTATLTVTATAGATTGVVTLTIHGTATGLTDQTTTVQVTVTAPSGSTNVTLDYTGCNAFVKPVWLAFQDGVGPWTRVTPNGDVYNFSIASTKGGYAYATVSGANSTVAVILLTKADFTGGTVVFCPATVLKTVNVTVAGLGASDVAFMALGGGNAFALSSTFNPVPITGVQSGLQDLVAYRTGVVGGPTAADRGIIVRDLNVANNGSAGTLDFAGGSLITPVGATITVAGLLAGDAMSGSMIYYTGATPATCTAATLYSIPSSTAAARGLFGIPAASQRATDIHSISLTEINGANTRSIQQSFHSFVTQTITLGANVATPTVTSPAQAGYKRLQAVGTIPADYPTSASLTYTQQGTAKSALVSATLGWLGGTAATLTFPDFSAVSGWDNSWVPAAGSTVDWTFMATDINYTGQPCSEGARLRAGRVKGVN